MKLFLASLFRILKSLVDPRNLPFFPIELVQYLKDYFKFKKVYHGSYPIKIQPVFFERTSSSTFDPHYVYQAYWATDRILSQDAPLFHVDISSNVAFIAQLCANCPVFQLEYRPPKLDLANHHCISGDIFNLPFADNSIHSLSCLHVIEHIGLGRYGDPVSNNGWLKGLMELNRIIAPGGNLYMSVPVGKPTVYFNGNYVFKASDIIDSVKNLTLVEFSYVDDHKKFVVHGHIMDTIDMEYSLGLFHFRK